METIIHTSLLQPSTGKYIKDGIIHIDNEIISYVNEKTSSDQIKKTADIVIDDLELITIPGFVNAHTHFPMSHFRTNFHYLKYKKWMKKVIEREKKLTIDDIRIGVVISCLESIRSGITSIGDFYNLSETFPIFRDFNLAGNIAKVFDGRDDSSLDNIKRGLGKLKYTCEQMRKQDRLRASIALQNPFYFSEDCLSLIRLYQISKKLQFHFHVNEYVNKSGREEDQREYFSIEKLDKLKLLSRNSILAHCTNCSEKELDLLRKIRAGIVLCPSSNLQLGCGIPNIEKVENMNINFGIGTDGVASSCSYDILREAKLLYLLSCNFGKKTLSANRLLRALTTDGAKILGIGNKISKLEEGSYGDLVLINKNHFNLFPFNEPYEAIMFSAGVHNISKVFVAGALAFDGKYVHCPKSIVDLIPEKLRTGIIEK